MKSSSMLLFVILLRLSVILCDCELRIGQTPPFLFMPVGSKVIVTKPKANSVIELKKSDKLSAFCASKLRVTVTTPSHSHSYPPRIPIQKDFENFAAFACNVPHEIVYTSTGFEGNTGQFANTSLNCLLPQELMYEASQRKLPNCEKHSNYVFGFKVPFAADWCIVTAEVCYDLNTLTLKYVAYANYQANDNMVFGSSGKNIEQQLEKLNIHNKKVGNELQNLTAYFTFMSGAAFNTSMSKLRSSKLMLHAIEFDYESLLQDAVLRDKLSGFAYIFNTIWWRQLRLGNWFYFQQALQQRTETHKCDIYMGTHGNVTLPAESIICNKSEIFSVKANGVNVIAPAYMWAYIKPLTNAGSTGNPGFVVIANNSPLQTNPFALCTDICDEIDWLKNSEFGRLRRTYALGYSVCCEPAQVEQIIDSFPTAFKEITPISETSTTYYEVEDEETTWDYYYGQIDV